MLRLLNAIAIALLAFGQSTAQSQEIVAGVLPPITVSMSNNASYPWYLSINSAGQAELSIDTPTPNRHTFELSESDMEVIRKAIETKSFFEIDSQCGLAIPSSPITSITIVLGMRAHTVHLGSISALLRSGKQDGLEQPRRLIHILSTLQQKISNYSLPYDPTPFYATVLKQGEAK
jgi:hypothetical protein